MKGDSARVVFSILLVAVAISLFSLFVVADPCGPGQDPIIDECEEAESPTVPGETSTPQQKPSIQSCKDIEGNKVNCPPNLGGAPGSIVDPTGILSKAPHKEGDACIIDERENLGTGWWQRIKKSFKDHPIAAASLVVGSVATILLITGVIVIPVGLGAIVSLLLLIGVPLGTALSGIYILSSASDDLAAKMNFAANKLVDCDVECTTGLCLANDAFNADGSINKNSIKPEGMCVSLNKENDKLFKAAKIGKGSIITVPPDRKCDINADVDNDGDPDGIHYITGEDGKTIINNYKITTTGDYAKAQCKLGEKAIEKLLSESGCNVDAECRDNFCFPLSQECKDATGGFVSKIPFIGEALGKSDLAFSGYCANRADICTDTSITGKLQCQLGISKSYMYSLAILVVLLTGGVIYFLRKNKKEKTSVANVFIPGRRR